MVLHSEINCTARCCITCSNSFVEVFWCHDFLQPEKYMSAFFPKTILPCNCKQQHSCRKCPQQGIADITFSILSSHLYSLNYFSSYGKDNVNLTISFLSKYWTLKFLDRYHANLINPQKNKYSTTVYCLSKPQKMEGRERNAMSNSTTMHGSPQDRAVLGKRPSWEISTVGLKKNVSMVLVSTISEWND